LLRPFAIEKVFDIRPPLVRRLEEIIEAAEE
jgi:hypothetical protein